MKKCVKILDSKSGKQVVEYPISIDYIALNIGEIDFYNEAWKCAVDDKLVELDKRLEYRFVIDSNS
ncbi:hypothetical protein ICN11_05020 [Polynucleobacter sp. 78F-HAINBA]|uniref:hypothetical protein n=1 Tax=Polynucleobacter sp. 78F-HAINBA TaxID=2689099 RepID=UPI001C0BCD21|nr:hypothetical protein [Polynucleobacter sp. 78F-HAINBA]MBU3591377.1 hypothetical protein [Polynucleobacter sp. 78F-HAINBA]